MSTTIGDIWTTYATQSSPALSTKPATTNATQTTFADALAEAQQEQETEVAGSAAASGSSTSSVLEQMGLNGSALSAILMNSLGGIGGLGGGSEEGSTGSMSSMMMFLLMFLLLNNHSSQTESTDGSFQVPEIESSGETVTGPDGTTYHYPAFDGDYGEIVESALTRLGDPYSQGKAGQDDYTDCSYLSRWCYRATGVEIPRTAAAQAEYCVNNDMTVSKEELEPGDLIFFSLKENGRYMNVSHVGIYAGNGMMVDASSNYGEVVYRPVFDGAVLYGRPRNA